MVVLFASYTEWYRITRYITARIMTLIALDRYFVIEFSTFTFSFSGFGFLIYMLFSDTHYTTVI